MKRWLLGAVDPKSACQPHGQYQLDMPPAGDSRLTHIWCTAAVAVTLCVFRPAEPAPGKRDETSRSSLTSILQASSMPVLRTDNGDPLVTVSLRFTVSVCLGDVEFSIACWERGLTEAAKRLEQIYLDDYMTRKAAGSLKVWFTVATERSEQQRFLREAEERAIKTVAAKLQMESNQGITSQMSSPEMNSPITDPPEERGETGGTGQNRSQQLQKWREDASLEARKGTNWSHDWSSKTHSYQLGLALHELAHIRDRSTN